MIRVLIWSKDELRNCKLEDTCLSHKRDCFKFLTVGIDIFLKLDDMKIYQFSDNIYFT